MKRIIENIDLFLSPSMFLKDFFEKNGVPREKIKFSKYGFHTKLIKYRKKTYSEDSRIKFGYMGRVIPVKGIKTLLDAFTGLHDTETFLLIFGEPGNHRKYLEKYTNENVKFMGSFKNWEMDGVLGQIDVLVAPSLWYENSPLVIQEALLAGIPIITTNLGGMKELVEDGKDGFLFELGDVASLRNIFEKIANNPTILNDLEINPSKVRSIREDAEFVLDIYRKVML